MTVTVTVTLTQPFRAHNNHHRMSYQLEIISEFSKLPSARELLPTKLPNHFYCSTAAFYFCYRPRTAISRLFFSV